MEKKTENKLLIILIIILLLSIFSYIIYLNGILIRDSNNINYNNHNINMVEPDNSSSRPVKGMKYKDSIDSLAFSKHIDLSNIDGDNFYSREINEGLTSGKVYK
jgi:hypothetical protein